MNKNKLILSLLFTTWITTPLGQQKEDGKNFYGTFEFRDCTKDNVEKITFNNDNKIMHVYKCPANFKKLPKEERIGSQNITRTTIYLKEDPAEVNRGPHELTTIKEIIIPHPHTDWVYEYPSKKKIKEKNKTERNKYKDKPKRKAQYTEIVIDGTPYLTPKKTQVKGVSTDTKKEKITVKKISRLHKIIIEGYKNNITKKSDGQNE